jgi:hypothetical protein
VVTRETSRPIQAAIMSFVTPSRAREVIKL